MDLFMLDTNICIYAMKRNESVLKNLLSRTPAQIHISIVTESELRFGAAKSAVPEKTLSAIENFLAPISIVDFTRDDAIAYADVRADLERRGTPIGPLDTFIAAQALARDFILVTNNQAEFKRVKGLHVENWA